MRWSAQQGTGFDAGGAFSLRSFEAHADAFKRAWFAAHPPLSSSSSSPSQSPAGVKHETLPSAASTASSASSASASVSASAVVLSAADIEREYWRIVETSPEAVAVCYGSDLSSAALGSGFPRATATGTPTATGTGTGTGTGTKNATGTAATGTVATGTAAAVPSAEPVRASAGTVSAAAVKSEPAANDTASSSTASESDAQLFARLNAEYASPSVAPPSSTSHLSDEENFARLNAVYGVTAPARPTKDSAVAAADDDNNVYAAHPWNLCNFPTQRGSVLRFLDRAINGVTQVRLCTVGGQCQKSS
jgi:hypothetical protein